MGGERVDMWNMRSRREMFGRRVYEDISTSNKGGYRQSSGIITKRDVWIAQMDLDIRRQFQYSFVLTDNA